MTPEVVAPAVGAPSVETVKFTLDAFGTVLPAFVKETFDRFDKISDLKRIPLGALILFSSVEEEVVTVNLKIYEGLAGEGTIIRYKDGSMSSEIKEYVPMSLEEVYIITDYFPGALKGAHKKEVLIIIAELIKNVDATVRVGGLYFKSKEDGTSKEGEALQKMVAEEMNKFSGMEVKFRWSDNCGKVQKVDGAGFNILLVNPSMKVFRELFRSGAHHYAHNRMYIFNASEDLKSVEKIEAEEKFMRVINPDYDPTPKVEEEVEGEIKSNPVVEKDPSETDSVVNESKVPGKGKKGKGSKRSSKQSQVTSK